MTLLRASIDPDPLPDLGEHVIEYALEPHTAGWSEGDGMRVGEETNIPLVVSSCGFHKGPLPATMSLIRCENKNVRLVALKKSLDGVLVRLVEGEGKKTGVRLNLAPELAPAGCRAVEVDTLERPKPANSARLDGGTLSVQVPAYGITAVRIDSPE